MKAVVYEKQGKPLIFRDVQKPVPKEDEVLVRVHTVSLNAADYRSMRLGLIPKSRIFGSDIAGVVEANGVNVHSFKPGDKVFADIIGAGFGGLAEYAAVPKRMLAAIPANVSFENAAALPIAASTALVALRDRGGIKPGHKVLIYGAGGGVGTYAVQLAKHFGAQVTAVCSGHNAALVQSIGADSVIDYTRQDITKSGNRYDLVLAVNGCRSLAEYRRLLAPGGVCVLVGGKLRQIFSCMLFGGLASTGGRKLSVLSFKPTTEDLKYLAGLVEQGIIRPVIDRRYPLEQGAEAMDYLAAGHSRGKVVVTVA